MTLGVSGSGGVATRTSPSRTTAASTLDGVNLCTPGAGHFREHGVRTLPVMPIPPKAQKKTTNGAKAGYVHETPEVGKDAGLGTWQATTKSAALFAPEYTGFCPINGSLALV